MLYAGRAVVITVILIDNFKESTFVKKCGVWHIDSINIQNTQM